MKKILTILFFLSFLNGMHAQPTWMYNLSYHISGGYPLLDNDNVCGIQDVSISPDSSLYIIAKIFPYHNYSLYKFDLNTDTVLWSASIYAAHYISSGISATADSGCIFYRNNSDLSGEKHSTIYKYSKNGSIQWSVMLPAISPYGGHVTNDIVRNNAGNYFALVNSSPPVGDTLYEYDNSGSVIDSMPLQGFSLFQMPNNDLLVQQTSQLVRMDLSGNITWTLPGAIKMISWDTSAVFICNPDTTNGIAVIKKVNPQNGGIVWTDTINQPKITSIVGTSDGGVIVSVGIPVTYKSLFYPPVNMTGQLIKIDSAGTVQWSKTYAFNEYGLSFVKELSPGNYLTSGTYNATYFDSPGASLTNCAFIATVDSAGNSILETASYMWPGDANNNDLVWAPEDVLYTVLASGKSGPVRITPSPVWYPWIGSSYAFDWTTSFANGVNHKHADFDNSGIVDSVDVNIYVSAPILWWPHNVGFRIAPQAFSTQPDLLLLPEKDSVAPGEVMRFYVIAGTAAMPVDSVYGIAFSAYYDYWLTDTSFSNITVSNSDFGILGTNLLGLCSGAPAGSDIRIVFSKTDNLNAYQLYDTLGVIELKANSGITSPQTLVLQFSSFYALTNITSSVNFNTINGSVVIDPALVSVNENQNTGVTVFPNPANKFLMLDNLEGGEKEMSIYNLQGQKIKMFVSQEENYRIPVTELENGIYNLVISSDNKKVYKKFSVNH